MDAISPELALVDQHLGVAAKDTLPDALDCLVPTQRPRYAELPARAARRPLGSTLGAAVACGLATIVLLAGDASRPSSSPSTASRTERVDRAPSVASASVKLRWRPVRGAAFYNVILWRGSVRALDLWPSTASIRITERGLKPGEYQWFVYPAFARGSSHRYGRVIAHGRLRI